MSGRMTEGSKPHCGQTGKKEWKAVRKMRIREFGMEFKANEVQRISKHSQNQTQLKSQK